MSKKTSGEVKTERGWCYYGPSGVVSQKVYDSREAARRARRMHAENKDHASDPDAPTAQKGVDSPAATVIELGQPSIPEAADRKPNERNKTMLTLKGLSKNGKRGIYVGAAKAVYFDKDAFADGNLPQTIDIPGLKAKEERVPKAKMTPEERKAARAARPKPTLAERIARSEARLASLRAQADASGEQAGAGM
jgi:hypothetical protein